MDRQMAGRLLEKQIDGFMAEGLDFPNAFMAAISMNPGQGLPAMSRQEALDLVRRLSNG